MPYKQRSGQEQNFRHLMEQAPVGILIVKGDDMIIDFANQAYLDIIGKSREVVGEKLWDVIPEVKTQGYDKLLKNVMETGKRFEAKEQNVNIVRHSKLNSGFFNFTFEALKNLDGTISMVMVMVLDVTDHVIEKQKLKLDEERVSHALEATGMGSYDLDITTGNIVTNERFNQIFGFMYDHDHRSMIDRLHPDDLGLREKAHKRAYATGHLSYEARIVWKNGRIRWFRTEGNVIFDEEKKPVRILGTVMDITNEREMRDELTKTADTLRMALKAGRIGSYVYDIASGRIECNEQCKENFGLERDQLFNIDQLVSMIVPEDRERMVGAVREALMNNSTYDIEYCVQWTDGSLHWIHASGLPVYDDNGAPLQMTGVTVEVTARKRMELVA